MNIADFRKLQQKTKEIESVKKALKYAKGEHKEQMLINIYCLKNDIDMWAVPNGGLRNAKTANDLKHEGVKSGVPDMMIPIPNKYYHGLFIELKDKPKTLKSGKLSTSHTKVPDNQKEWLDKLNNNGYKAIVCYGADEAIEAIEDYIENTLPKMN